MRKMNERNAAIAFAVMTAVGFLLRRLQLSDGYDIDGLPRPGAGILLGLYAAAVAVLAFLYCAKMKNRNRAIDGKAFAFFMPTACVSAVGAGLILAGCVLSFFASGSGFSLEKATAIVGVVTALCMVASLSAQYKDKPLHPLAAMVPIIFCIMRLIGDFKKWSTDPIILDYWVKLFAMLGILLAFYSLGGFALGKGKRSATAFYCLLAVFFSGMCLADGGAEFSLIVGGSMLWTGACGWLLLRPDEGPSEAAEPEA